MEPRKMMDKLRTKSYSRESKDDDVDKQNDSQYVK